MLLPHHASSLHCYRSFCGRAWKLRSEVPGTSSSSFAKTGLFLLLASRFLGLRSHSRPQEIPFSQRNRMLKRRQYSRPTGMPKGSKPSKQLFFMTTPTDPKLNLRENRTAPTRQTMKSSRSAKELLDRFKEAMDEGMVDRSVVGAAFQRCGNGRWWDTLFHIRNLQNESEIALTSIEERLLLHAVTSCLKCYKCPGWEMEIRKEKALQIGKNIWGGLWDHELPPSDEDFNCGLTNALKLCFHVGNEEAFMWADTLWKWSEQQSFQKNMVSYYAMLSVCEMQRRHDEVDKLLMECSERKFPLDEVLLGDLVARATTAFDCKRADVLWRTLVDQYQIQPNFLAYAAYSQAHMAAGNPQQALKIIDEMIQAGRGPMNYKIALDYLQSLLIVCHSSMSPLHLERLSTFLQECGEIVRQRSAQSGKKQWTAMKMMSLKLISGGTPRFKDLLFARHAKTGIMKTWANHLAGSNYLPG